MFGFARGRRIGVDLEYVRADINVVGLARSYFSTDEFRPFSRLRASEQCEAFYRAWTRKEAYLIACGEGLSFGLDQVEVSLIPTEPAIIWNILGFPNVSEGWTLKHLSPAAGYLGAAAVESKRVEFRFFKLAHTQLARGPAERCFVAGSDAGNAKSHFLGQSLYNLHVEKRKIIFCHRINRDAISCQIGPAPLRIPITYLGPTSSVKKRVIRPANGPGYRLAFSRFFHISPKRRGGRRGTRSPAGLSHRPSLLLQTRAATRPVCDVSMPSKSGRSVASRLLCRRSHLGMSAPRRSRNASLDQFTSLSLTYVVHLRIVTLSTSHGPASL